MAKGKNIKAANANNNNRPSLNGKLGCASPPLQNAAHLRALPEMDKYRFVCPITMTVMTDPVMIDDGTATSYEKSEIVKWFVRQRELGHPVTSPVTGLALSSTKITPNTELLRQIEEFMVANNQIAVSDIHFGLSSEIFKDLDRIPTLLAELKLLTPIIIVLGNESHGKSSVLERIIGLPVFPRDKGLCTRCVIRVQMRRCAPEEACPAEISVANRADKVTIPGSTRVVALDHIRSVIKTMMDELRKNEPTKEIIDDKEIVVKLRLPYCLNLDLLDLPGLVAVNPDNAVQNVPKATEELAMSVIEENKAISMFLLVNDIKLAGNQSRGCEIVQNAKLQDRTIGIFTKIDTFSSEDGDEIKELRDLIECKTKSSFKLKQGWLATSSRRSTMETKPSVLEPSESVKEMIYLNAINDAEDELISRRFSELIDTNLLGIYNIRQKLQSSYESFIIHQWVPAILASLKPPQDALEKKIIDMGLPLAKCPEYDPYLKYFTFSQPPITLQLVNDFLDERIKFALSGNSQWLSLKNERDVWGNIMLYCNCLARTKVDSAVPFKSTNSGFYGSKHARDQMAAQYFNTSNDAKGWMVKQHEVRDAQQSLVNELMSSLSKMLELLQRRSTGMTNTLMSIINQERDGTTITKFERFLAIQQHLRTIAEGQFKLINSDLMEFFEDHISKFFVLDPVTSSYNELFAVEYFYDEIDVWGCLHVKNPMQIQELPHLLLHKWNELAYRHVRGIQGLIQIDENMLAMEDCKSFKLESMKSYAEYQNVEAAVREFAKKAEGKLDHNAKA